MIGKQPAVPEKCARAPCARCIRWSTRLESHIMGKTSTNQRFEGNAEVDTQRARFAWLLDKFSAFAVTMPSGRNPDHSRTLPSSDQSGQVRAHAGASDRNRISTLLAGFREAEERHRLEQEQCADDFNLLEVLKLTGNEIRHSMVLAWLLDHDLRRLGTHAQGKRGFRLFLKEFELPPRYADVNYWVRREVRGAESTVDVEVACRREFLIHIEIKIWSEEGTDQTDREWADVLRRINQLELRGELADTAVHALYLTPHGDTPANSDFVPISWQSIAGVFDKFADQAQPRNVKLFARHCARTLRRFTMTDDRSADYHGPTVDE